MVRTPINSSRPAPPAGDQTCEPQSKNPDHSELRHEAQDDQIRVPGDEKSLHQLVSRTDQKPGDANQPDDGPIAATYGPHDQDKNRQQQQNKVRSPRARHAETP